MVLTHRYVCYDLRMVKDKFYYIVGVSLLVLLVLVVYVGNRAQILELGLVNVDARLSFIESQLNITESAAYYGDETDPYGASVYDTLNGSQYNESAYDEYAPYDYVVE